MTTTQITATFTDTELDMLLERYLSSLAYRLPSFADEPLSKEYGKIFKSVVGVGPDFYWDQLESIYDYYDQDEHQQWLINQGECEDWEEAGDYLLELADCWDGCDYIDWAFKYDPENNQRKAMDATKELFLENAWDEIDSPSDLDEDEMLNNLIVDIELAQKVLDSLS